MNMEELVANNTVDGVLGFMERYQSRMADLDNRVLELEQQWKKLQEEIKVLEDRADKVNPNKTRTENTETVR